MKNKNSLIVGTLFLLVFLPLITYAKQGSDNDNDSNNNTITLDNPLGNKVDNLPSFIYMILDIVFQIGAVFAVMILMYVGFMFVSARGDPEKLVTARRAFLYTVIGIGLLLGGKLVASVIENTISQVSTGIY